MLGNKVWGSHFQNKMLNPGKQRLQGGRHLTTWCIKWDLQERTDCVTSVYSTSYWNVSIIQKGCGKMEKDLAE